MLGDRQRQTLVQFLDAIAELCAPCHDQAKIGVLKEKVDVALALLERDFPLSLQVKDSVTYMISSMLHNVSVLEWFNLEKFSYCLAFIY